METFIGRSLMLYSPSAALYFTLNAFPWRIIKALKSTPLHTITFYQFWNVL